MCYVIRLQLCPCAPFLKIKLYSKSFRNLEVKIKSDLSCKFSIEKHILNKI